MKARHNSLWRALRGPVAPLLVIVACALAYANALGGPFVFDDLTAVVNNEFLPPRTLGECFSAPAGSTASGRPLVALSFALNHALFGESVFGWHASNVLLHTLCALVLLGLVRETLARAKNEDAHPIAVITALLWALHPLLTDAVNLVASRSELFVSLAYLLTLYSLSKAASARSPWTLLCVLACAAGMASKEVMASAPLIAFAWDRTFIAGSWRAAWTSRRGLHLSLAATWLVLAACVLAADRGASVSLGSTAVSTWESLCTQAGAIVHYLRLVIWPAPLSIDYAGWPVVRDLTQVLPQALGLLALGVIALRRLHLGRADGLLLVAFFAILAPSSSLIPLTGELVAEHRMYLASAPLVALFVLTIYRFAGPTALLVTSLLLTPVLSWATHARNEDWSSARSIWQSATETDQENWRAWNNLGSAFKSDDPVKAADAWRRALELKGDDYHAHGQLGELFRKRKDFEQAIFHYSQSLKSKPDQPDILFNLGLVLLGKKDYEGAEASLQQALQIAPDSWSFHKRAQRFLAEARKHR